MKCIYCGAELSENARFCPQCGKATQMVVGESVLEDEYLNSLVGDNHETLDLPNIKRTAVRMEEPKAAAASQKSKPKSKKKNDNKRTLILSLVLLAVLVLVAVLLVHGVQTNSFDYQQKKAKQAVEKGNIAEAIAYYEKAIRLDSTNVDARMELADLYCENGEKDGAKVMYMEVIRIDASNVDAYRGLIDLYEQEGNTDAIILLAQSVTDENVLALFSDYTVDGPWFSVEGGNYDHYLHVELSAPEGTSIYYTTDRTDPVTYGKEYSLPIELNQMKSYTINAVVRNEKGIYGNVVTKEYTIAIPAPELPVVFPDGGEFNQETLVLVEVPEGDNAYYTWDGSTPSVLSTPYAEPFAVPEGNHVLSVIIIDPVTEQCSEVYTQYFAYYP